MRVLIDECLPPQLRFDLPGHDARSVRYMGWLSVKNGELLERAEAHFDVFLTQDRGIPRQHDLSKYDIAIIMLVAPDNDIDTVRSLMPQVLTALETIQPGDFVEIRAQP